jgi:hypothetical protein
MLIGNFSSFSGGPKAHERLLRKVFASGAHREPLADPLAGAEARPTEFCVFCGWANGTGTHEPRHGQVPGYTRHSVKCFASHKLSA